jgi:phosphate-selective porin OprO and OprP
MQFGRFTRDLAIVVTTATVASAAYAQAPAQTPGPAPVSAPAAPQVGPPFTIQSNGGDNLLQIDVLAQLDGRFAVTDDAGTFVNTFLMRRMRPILQGRVLRRFEFFFNPDFGQGTTVLFDAYVDTVFSTAFRLRFGKSKTPMGLERLIAANSLVFAERSLASELTPNRDVGVQVLGDVAGNTFSYMASVTNGVTDNASGDSDTNDNKEVTVRLVGRPFVRRTASPLSGLGVAIDSSTGVITELPVLRTASLMQTFLSYAGATGDGNRVRVGAQAFYYRKAFAAFGEYAYSAQPIRRGAVVADIAHTAWNVSGSYVLTGEVVTQGAVRPRNNFNFGHGSIGAIQVAARFHAVEVDEDAITLGLAIPGSSRKAEAVTAGVNWYLNPFLRYVFNVERTVFDDDPGRPRPPENAVVFRAQFFF